jgi:hypothetical protein
MAKSLNYLKNNRAKHGERFEHRGREVTFHAQTPRYSRHYKLHPTNIFGTTSSKKRAIKYLEKGI